jgi:hypothetical protein
MQQKKPVVATLLTKFLEENLFKLFFKSHERIKTNIFLKFSPTIIALIMNVPPIMAIPFANYEYSYLNIMITKIQFYTFDS